MNFKNQNGATMWGWLGIVFMVGFNAMLAFNVVPIYVEHQTIRSAIQDVVDSREFSTMSNSKVIINLRGRLRINNVRGIDSKAFKVSQDRTGDKYILINYSQKVSIMSNLSAVVDFNEEVRKSR